VAIGTSDTPMGRRERALGLDRLPIAEGGLAVDAFQSGQSHLAHHADREPGEVTAVVESLGVRSSVTVPIEVAGTRRGVLVASSATPDFFNEQDLRFVEAVARWVGLVAYRTAYTERLVVLASEEAMRLIAEQAIEVLTLRQQDVARLIGAGLTNQQIARELVITPGTAANHVEAILRKLGVASRVHIATWAIECGLYRQDTEEQAT
jgi:DNA-binding CsgD family transcriptional regulator